MWNNLERRFGRFAIPRLMNYIIGGYAIGYLLYFMYRVTGLNYLAYLALDPYQILHITNGIPSGLETDYLGFDSALWIHLYGSHLRRNHDGFLLAAR